MGRKEVVRTYSGLTPEQRVAQRRQRLLASALQHFGTEGYAATTIERLCSTAKVSTKSFYQEYANKEAAFLDLYDDLTRQSFEAAVESLAQSEGRPMAERIPDALLAYARPMIRDVRAARIAFVEIMGVSPAVEARRLEYRESLVSVVESHARPAVARGEVTDRDFRFATVCLAGALNAAAYDWVTRTTREPDAEIEAKLAKLALDLLAG